MNDIPLLLLFRLLTLIESLVRKHNTKDLDPDETEVVPDPN